MDAMNEILAYAANEEKMFEKTLENFGTYRRKTTFFADLSIAERFGADAIRQTFDKVEKNWLGNVEYFTEFILALNHKAWEWDARCDEAYSKLYAELYYEADERFNANYEHDEAALEYYFQVTD